MFKKVLIANRGAIACRIIRTLRKMGVGSVAVYSDADQGSLHVAQADEAVRIGPAPATESYLRVDAILEAARATGAEAIHPGYGFLSENAAFAEACAAAGIAFIGPDPANLRAFGLKHTARALAQEAGVPLAPGTGLLNDADQALRAAAEIRFPVILKATAGGGGIGMRVCERPEDVLDAFAIVQRMASGAFGDAGVFLERYVRSARHIEVQIFGDGAGRVTALGERDCSLQRRNQKVFEETPAPHLPSATRAALLDAAVRLAEAAQYRSAGTVEFLYDAERDDFFFLEVNTRLQVEHGVTEEVTSVDIVEWMIRGAAGDFTFLDAPPPAPRGASIQARLYAENPALNYQPSSGIVTEAHFPANARIDRWIEAGVEVSAHYDPLLAKIIVHAPDRPTAVKALQNALAQTRVAGFETNLAWLRAIAASEAFTSGNVATRALEQIDWTPDAIQVVSGGPATTVQDYPGRLGYWDVGVPPSGPMDAFSFRLGNASLGNPPDAAGLEFTSIGPTLRFMRPAWFCLTGPAFDATLDGKPIPFWRPIEAPAGSLLKIGRVRGPGLRGYLTFVGGIDAPLYLGSRSAFTLGGFGGHAAGRALAAGDVLRLLPASHSPPQGITSYTSEEPPREKTLRVLIGPHGAPDFFTPDDMAMLASKSWTVHYNSNRTGVRLIGPKPHWARRDGGEAGLHPSNIHDNAYAIGAIDFTGDTPIILGPDGPSLGGFVCPLVIIQADLGGVGQLAPGDTLRFEIVDEETAADALARMEAFLEKGPFKEPSIASAKRREASSPVLLKTPESGKRPQATYRRQGDQHLLVEFGPNVLDLQLRMRVHALWQRLKESESAGIVDLTPGIRSLQVHYDSRVLAQEKLLDLLAETDDALGELDDLETPSRIVHLPLSWNDPAVRQTIEKYQQAVRDDAPWTPDNIEFIRRINGLQSADDVQRIVFDASYLVMGLGDVYLGAPVATPIDPRHRLVTTKYNPARTWTPPNVVGIGGAYMCIYGMEGPGGYQLFGRTIQVWNSWRTTREFEAGKPWLLRFFDQIRFFPVSAEELVEWRREFPLGRRPIKIEETVFKLAEYRAMLEREHESIAEFQQKRQAAFDAERAAWEARGEFARVAELSSDTADDGHDTAAVEIPEGAELIEAPLGGNVWKVLKEIGADIAADENVAIIEAMKTEVAVASPVAGCVVAVFVKPDQAVPAGAPMFAIKPLHAV